MQAVKDIAKSFLNLLYPLHCLGCGKALGSLDEFHLCTLCIASIKPNAMPPLELEDTPVKAYSACLYEGTLKELIHQFKYKGKTNLVKIFSRLMTDYIKENPEIADVDIITVVPLHKKRLKEREFNQSLLLANAIAKEYGLSLKNTLEKTRKTRYQNELLKSERHTNLKDAFKICDKMKVNGQDILLIDDVMTTGATLGECAKTLLDGGAKKVSCLTLARGI
jgi:competence protein ComFC